MTPQRILWLAHVVWFVIMLVLIMILLFAFASLINKARAHPGSWQLSVCGQWCVPLGTPVPASHICQSMRRAIGNAYGAGYTVECIRVDSAT